MSITPREPADFTPSRGNYTELKPFRFWCQKVLPLVYDDSLSYYELLCKVVNFLNKTMEDVETLEGDVTGLHTAYVELQTYVNEYFSTLDVQEEINNKLDELAESGALNELIDPLLPDLISAWLSEHLTPTTPVIDDTLTIRGAGADAKATGDRFKSSITLTGNTDILTLQGGKYSVLSGSGYTNLPDECISAPAGYLVVSETSLNLTWYLYQNFSNGIAYIRYKSTLTTTPWHRYSPFEPITSFIDDYTVDINTLTESAIYNTLAGNRDNPNFPPTTSGVGTLIVTKEISSGIIYQYFIDAYSGRISSRIKRTSGWDAWAKYDAFTPTMSFISDYTLDINTLDAPNIYNTLAGNRANPHFPTDCSGVGTLIVTKEISSGLVYQYYLDAYYGAVFSRVKRSNGWDNWNIKGRFIVLTDLVGVTNIDLNTLTENNVYATLAGNRNNPNFPPTSNDVGILSVFHETKANIVYQIYTSAYDGSVWGRIKRESGWDEWRTFTNREISILFIGNSLTQDAISYLPYILTTYFPEVKFRFYMWYIGGADLNAQYTAFTNNTPADIFSIAENTLSWTNLNNVTMASVLNDYKFDIVCLQEYFNYKSSYTVNDLTVWNNIRDYIGNRYSKNGLEFISLLHAPKRDDAENIYNLTVSANKLIYNNTICQDILNVGSVIYDALSTTLNNLGDEGGLSSDGTHCQEGLGCLMQTFIACLWVLNKLGFQKSVYIIPARITTNVYNSLNVPGANIGTGVITGTDPENKLGQELAIKAYKNTIKLILNL